LTAVVRLVRSASRLVTIVGPEGIGKTRLAYRAAEEMAPSFPDGVSVQGPPDPGSAASAVPDGSRMLLVWDGCEDTAEACAAAAIDLLRRAPEVHVLATSRHPLGVPGESVWRIGPLSEADAVKLFCERAGVPQLDENVRRICRETGGHPLVVEAVAANHRAANHPA
jgi:predicted ATPase